MNGTHLSKRLEKVAEYVPEGARLADIGSDHAYLPIHLVATGQIDYAIAGEVARGPHENATQEISHAQLTDRITSRLADGLFAIELTDKIDTVTIAGMGGTLIAHILEAGQSRLNHSERLILQPNVGADNVRRFLQDHRYRISSEDILEEDGHIYEIIVADPTDQKITYSPLDLQFGPFLLQSKGPAFEAKWQREANRLKQVIATMKQAEKVPVDKVSDFEAELNQILEVIA